jgi:hypothetical protein
MSYNFWQPSYNKVSDDKILKFIDLLLILPIDNDIGRLKAIETFKKQISLEKKEYEDKLSSKNPQEIKEEYIEINKSHNQYVTGLKYAEIDRIIIDNEKTGLLQDRKKIKNEIMILINEKLNSKFKFIKWKKIKEFKDLMKKNKYLGYIFIVNPPDEGYEFIRKSKKQIRNEIKKYQNKMLEIFKDIDALCSKKQLENQERIIEETRIRNAVKTLLEIYINNLLDDDESRENLLHFFNFDPIF